MRAIRSAQKKRGMGESIDSIVGEIDTLPDYSRLNNKEFRNRLPEILHTACFLSLFALNAGTASIEDILGDEGVIHELAHAIANIDGCNKKSLNCLRDLVKNLQQQAIGFYDPV